MFIRLINNNVADIIDASTMAQIMLPAALKNQYIEFPDTSIVEIGWVYDESTTSFKEGDMLIKALNDFKDQAIVQTKQWVAIELDKGVEFDGEIYNASKEKQDLLANQLGLYVLNQTLGIADELTWNTKGGACIAWSLPDLTKLANALKARAKPLQKIQQDAEIEIKGAKTREEVEEILKDFI